MTFSAFPRVERTAPSKLSSLICLSSFGFGLCRRLGDFGAGASGDRGHFGVAGLLAQTRPLGPTTLLLTTRHQPCALRGGRLTPSPLGRPGRLTATPLSPLRRHSSGLVGLRRADLRQQLI